MFCSNCGNTIPGGSRVCPYCGKPVAGIGMGGSAYQRQHGRINNIFTALMQERTPGAVWEFALWCTVCVCVILSMAAMIAVSSWMEEFTVACRLVWLFVMLFEIGTGVLMAFRLKPIMLYVSSITLQLVMPIFIYVVYAMAYSRMDEDVPAGMVVMFILLLLAAIGLIVCGSMQFFTRIEMGKITAILDVVVASCMFFFVIVTAVSSDSVTGWIISRSGFGPGAVSLIAIHAALAVFYMLFFFGCIDSRAKKINIQGGISEGSPRNHTAFTPGLQCIRGQHQGQIMYLQGHDLTFGSQPGEVAVVIPGQYISRRHCAVRYDHGAGMYGILDVSTNGVYLTNPDGSTQRIPSGQYISCRRGSVISLGSMEQQFRLL